MKHQIPLGGEDLDRYSGAPRLIRATGTEPFEANTKGEKVVEFVDVGEVVWCDDKGITCRRWNWRQGPRTALEESTTRVLFILDVLDPVTDAEVETTGDELVSVLRKTLPGMVVAKRMVGRFESLCSLDDEFVSFVFAGRWNISTSSIDTFL